MLNINNLHVSVGDKPILKGLTLEVPAGEVHAVMGPNGAGKSTLGYALSGRPGYEATDGSVAWNGEDLLELEPAERAAKGVFLSFQYPIEIPGVPALTFVRTALNAQKRARGEDEVSAPAFLKLVREASKRLRMDFDMLKRPLNVGFSGGEKKRHEVMQLALMKPKFAVMDETDSGLDVDALRIVSAGINRYQEETNGGVLMITHYKRILNYVTPDFVHIFADGKIVATGGAELADVLESEGYEKFI